jgi:hypothetical protein
MNIDIAKHQKNLNKLLFISDKKIEKLSTSIHNFIKNIRPDLIKGCAICGKLGELVIREMSGEVTECRCGCTEVIYKDNSFKIVKDFGIDIKKSGNLLDILLFHISLSFFIIKDIEIFPYYMTPTNLSEKYTFMQEFFTNPLVLYLNRPLKPSKPVLFSITYWENKKELSFLVSFETANKSIWKTGVILNKNYEYHQLMRESDSKLNNLMIKIMYPYLKECFELLKNLRRRE